MLALSSFSDIVYIVVSSTTNHNFFSRLRHYFISLIIKKGITQSSRKATHSLIYFGNQGTLDLKDFIRIITLAILASLSLLFKTLVVDSIFFPGRMNNLGHGSQTATFKKFNMHASFSTSTKL